MSIGDLSPRTRGRRIFGAEWIGGRGIVREHSNGTRGGIAAEEYGHGCQREDGSKEERAGFGLHNSIVSCFFPRPGAR